MDSTDAPTAMPSSAPTVEETLAPIAAPTFRPANYSKDPVSQVVAMSALTGLAMIISLLVTIRLINFFARRDTPFWAKLMTGLSWFMGIAGVLVLLPLDLVFEFFFEMNSTLIAKAWQTVYWSTFVLAWITCPVGQEYHVAGNFTFRSRFFEAVYLTIRTYLIFLVIILIVLVLVWFFRGLDAAFVVAAANFYGMFLIVIMVGYGCVEIPLSFWREADPRLALATQHFRAGSVQTEMADASDAVQQAVEEIEGFKLRLARAGGAAGADSARLNALIEEVLAKAPHRESTAASRTLGSSNRAASAVLSQPPTSHASSELPLTVGTLAKLHSKLKVTIVAAERAKYEMDSLLEKADALEAVIAKTHRSAGSVEPVDAASVPPDHASDIVETEGGVLVPRSSLSRLCKRSRKTCGYCLTRYYATYHRILALLTASLTLVLLWCCVVAPFSVQLSLFGFLIHTSATPAATWLVSFFPLLYMAASCYTALFKFKYLDALSLHANRQTDAYNLLYNASYMGRLQFSLGVAYFNTLYPQDSMLTAFHDLVGDMDTVPFLGGNFNKFAPLLMLFFALASFFNAGDRCLDFMGISTHKRPRLGVPEHEERIEAGRMLVQHARKRREDERQRQYRLQMMQMGGVAGSLGGSRSGAAGIALPTASRASRERSDFFASNPFAAAGNSGSAGNSVSGMNPSNGSALSQAAAVQDYARVEDLLERL